MIKCLILDDEQHAIDLLKTYIEKIPLLELVHATTSPLEALTVLGQKKVDLVFSDINMPEISGIDFTRAIANKQQIIFTSAHGEFALEGFENDVVDFLLKPIAFSRFLKSVQKASALISSAKQLQTSAEENFIFVKTEQKGKLIKINFDDIDYVEGMKNYVGIYLKGECVMALMNMKYLEEILPERLFVRVHNSYIISINNIEMVEGNQVRLRNVSGKIPIGVTYKPNFIERINLKGKDIF
ncbi:LytR/AlgR family response regulator transcription factor [Pedobacter sp. AW1-32]|uniref:LytR/AlgR family response regulator transcription factor n=1 Tax=Pedobacter sp. AW1-32 TaxID=3383026 RepID=UPI003FEEDD6B